jgi:hypothetical protein
MAVAHRWHTETQFLRTNRDHCGQTKEAIHHPGHDSDRLRGGAALLGNIQTSIEVTTNKDDSRQFVVKKQKDGRDNWCGIFELADDEVFDANGEARADSDGEPLTTKHITYTATGWGDELLAGGGGGQTRERTSQVGFDTDTLKLAFAECMMNAADFTPHADTGTPGQPVKAVRRQDLQAEWDRRSTDASDADNEEEAEKKRKKRFENALTKWKRETGRAVQTETTRLQGVAGQHTFVWLTESLDSLT